MSKRLTDSQKRKARAALARKRNVSESSISDYDLTSAITDGVLSTIDFGSSYDSSCYDSSSSSSSSYDSGCSSSDW